MTRSIEGGKWLQAVYISEIITLCDDAVVAAAYINETLHQKPINLLFYHLRALVSSTALISQFLWPIKTDERRARERGQSLRELLKLVDTSRLKSRKFRHHLAHFDERMDRWAAESPNRNLARRIVGPRSMIGGSSIVAGDFIEHYVPSERIFIFRGDEFPVQDIVTDLIALRARCAEVEASLRSQLASAA